MKRGTRPTAPLLLLFGGLLLCALVALWFFTSWERKLVPVQVGLSRAALRNPYLAAERFLKAGGWTVFSRRELELPANGALFIRRFPTAMNRRIGERLMTWVEDGGHLVFMPRRKLAAKPEGFSIMSLLGAERRKEAPACCRQETEESDSEKENGTTEEGREPALYNVIVNLNLTGEKNEEMELMSLCTPQLHDLGGRALAEVRPRFVRREKEQKAQEDRFEDKNSEGSKAEGAWLLRYRYGAGVVTILSDQSFLTNSSLGRYDHALFLSWLFKDDSKVTFLADITSAGLMSRLWRSMAPLVVVCLLVATLFLWNRGLRLGPLRKINREENRNILDHVRAAGMFYWRHGKMRKQLRENRAELLRLLLLRRGGGSQQLNDLLKQPEKIAATLGLQKMATTLHTAFAGKCNREQQFVDCTRAMKKVRKQSIERKRTR